MKMIPSYEQAVRSINAAFDDAIHNCVGTALCTEVERQLLLALVDDYFQMKAQVRAIDTLAKGIVKVAAIPSTPITQLATDIIKVINIAEGRQIDENAT